MCFRYIFLELVRTYCKYHFPKSVTLWKIGKIGKWTFKTIYLSGPNQNCGSINTNVLKYDSVKKKQKKKHTHLSLVQISFLRLCGNKKPNTDNKFHYKQHKTIKTKSFNFYVGLKLKNREQSIFLFSLLFRLLTINSTNKSQYNLIIMRINLNPVTNNMTYGRST